MSEIQSVADPQCLKYYIVVVCGLASIINALIIYIFRHVKKDIEKIKIKQDIDHDQLNQLLAEHHLYHSAKT